MASSSAQTVATILLGVTGIAVSVVSVWQGYRFWTLWHDHRRFQHAQLILNPVYDRSTIPMAPPKAKLIEPKWSATLRQQPIVRGPGPSPRLSATALTDTSLSSHNVQGNADSALLTAPNSVSPADFSNGLEPSTATEKDGNKDLAAP